MINNKWRTIAIIIGILTLIGVGVSVYFAMQPKLTLYSNVDDLTTIKVNGTETAFTDGMSIPFADATTIEVEKEGYYPASWTLDPKQQTQQVFTIELTANPTGTDTSLNAQIINNYQAPDTTIAPNELSDILLQAALTTGTTSIMDFNQALNVDIVETKVLDYGSYIAYVIAKQPPNTTDNALVVVEKNDDKYTVIMGPGTNFDGSTTAGLPPSLVSFMQEKGYIQ
ncbi:MAG: hypothetical protein PVI21_02705 [Candidatus Woesebacteria bacterium]|jgi:hypothetical protein